MGLDGIVIRFDDPGFLYAVFVYFYREQVELALQYLALSQVVARGPGKKNVLRKRKYVSKVSTKNKTKTKTTCIKADIIL